MKRNHNALLTVLATVTVVAGVFHFLGGDLQRTGVPVALSLVIVLTGIALAAGRRRPSRSETVPKTEISLPRVVQKSATEEVEPVPPTAALGREFRKDRWNETEAQVDALLDAGLHLLQSRTDGHTVAVFFPTTDGGYMLRRFCSPSEHINREAILYPGVGVIGGFLKDGLKQLNLREIVSDSMTLYYYTRDVGVRSLMASPMTAGGVERGTVIVDSLSPKKFTDEDHAFLGEVAMLLGKAIYSTYMHTEHKLQHGRLAAMSSIEKEFFRNLSRQSIVDRIAEIVPHALPCDRLTISMKNDEGDSAKILAAIGCDADGFTDKQFPITGKSLASVLYTSNIVLCRNFSEEHYETRYIADEPRNEELRSFVAVPLGVDECKGMVLVESFRENAYDESYRELLGRLSTSAGLAIEKMLIFEKANALATHDGLTGLNNHRTFQQVLADEITRAIRYQEPVSLVICDIDHFKRVNDTWGHPFGDVVLKGVSSVLESSVRQDIDTVARYGGEEFALILVKTDDQGAVETAERIRSAIAAVPFKSPQGGEVQVTMSFGISEYRKHAKQLNELIAKADKALYRAKENGRNRVEVF